MPVVGSIKISNFNVIQYTPSFQKANPTRVPYISIDNNVYVNRVGHILDTSGPAGLILATPRFIMRKRGAT